MLVQQAAGGTNKPGVHPDVFSMPAGLRMRYDVPAASLASCVTGYAVYICEERAPMSNWYLPAPGMMIILLDAGPMAVQFRARHESDLPRATVWGPTTQAYRTITQGGISVGVGLTAEGWSRLTRLSAKQSCDRTFALSAVIGSASATALVAALDSLTQDAQIAPLLDDLLPPLFDDASPADLQTRMLEQAVSDSSVADVGSLARRLGVDSRTVSKLCSDRMGMTAKALLTRARFIRSYARWLEVGRPSGYQGIDSRYFDDAHFLRDARNFLNSTPRRLEELETVYLRTSMRARAAVIGSAAHALQATA